MKKTILTFIEKKRKGEKLVLLTAYDYPTALIVDEAGFDGILVGDSLGMVIQGGESTLHVTLEDTIYHTRIVRRAVKNALLIADMPFMSYQVSIEDAIKNCGRVVKETGAEAVKLEGGREIAELVEKLVNIGIPVMGHLGLTPQKVHVFGGYRVQGREEESAERIKEDAKILEEAGVFSIVLEGIPASLAKKITNLLNIPTIGIGAGPYVDGQILVFHDILNLYPGRKPKFVKVYADLHDIILQALKKFINEVKEGIYPGEEHSYE